MIADYYVYCGYVVRGLSTCMVWYSILDTSAIATVYVIYRGTVKCITGKHRYRELFLWLVYTMALP